MEKKVIDLRDCERDIEILFPEKYDHYDMDLDHLRRIEIYAKKNPFDLVPKSFDELIKKKISYFYNFHKDNFVSYGNIPKDKNLRVLACTDRDAVAFIALMKLRILWHEWVRILGKPSLGQINYYITYNEATNEIDIENCLEINGLLVFDEQFHAEKFIECFKELLDKVKILL